MKAKFIIAKKKEWEKLIKAEAIEVLSPSKAMIMRSGIIIIKD